MTEAKPREGDCTNVFLRPILWVSGENFDGVRAVMLAKEE